MIYYNYLYTILCGYADGARRSNYINNDLPNTIKVIVNALIPPNCTQTQKQLLTELYIKLIKTDAALNKKLLKVDPYNSYDIVNYDIIQEPSDNIDLIKIADNLKNLQIINIRYDDCIGYILRGLEELINRCINNI